MKRYFGSIIMVMVILLSIGTYYVKIASSASNLPKYTFKTLEGNDKELETVIIHGSYEENPTMHEELTIESNQTIYTSEKSYLENLIGPQDKRIEKLVKEHRSFMRGKENIDSFYEDNDFLAYVPVTNNREVRIKPIPMKFDVALLEKKSKDETSFEIEVPEQERFWSIDVRDVQLIQSKLQVVTRNDVKTNGENQSTEIHLYTIDLANKKIVKDETLIAETFNNTTQGYVEMPTSVSSMQPNNLILFTLVKGLYNEDGNFKEKPSESSLLIYNYETRKLEKVTLPKKLSGSYESIRDGYFDEENLYIIKRGSKNNHVVTFNISSQSVTSDYKFDDQSLHNDEDGFSTTVKNGRVYILGTNGMYEEKGEYKPAQLLIADLQTGKTLYKGETVIQSADQKKNHGLYVNYLEVQ
ncbi:hypothetical protein [Peribacillus butanolivorans]|uniref:HlyD family secretion protein n=1 Tax=Peribacillus butanolivorans TaxID=421767 RepID=A0ABN5N5K7_9BACI|nr:hypothetical protein [Peribacillus butanolivorans]AXN38397.1 hypothetical protein DTO10_08110 [Peribacillus butanolivorans]